MSGFRDRLEAVDATVWTSILRLGCSLGTRGLDLGELDGEFLLDELFRDAEAVETRGRVAVLGQDADQQVFGPDVVVATLQGGSQRLLESGSDRVRDRQFAGCRCLVRQVGRVGRR